MMHKVLLVVIPNRRLDEGVFDDGDDEGDDDDGDDDDDDEEEGAGASWCVTMEISIPLALTINTVEGCPVSTYIHNEKEGQ